MAVLCGIGGLVAWLSLPLWPRRSVKVCVDCKWYSQAMSGHHYCKHPKAGDVDIVTGDHIACARIERNWMNKCGPHGRLFEDIDESNGV